MDDKGCIPECIEHTYLEPGQYTVVLDQNNAGGAAAITKYRYITVSGLTKPVASFTAEKVSVPKSLTIAFTDVSIGKPASWCWNFGDGAYSTERSPTHTYSAAGNYTVNLTASNENGTASKIITISVEKKSSSGTGGGNSGTGKVSIVSSETVKDEVKDTTGKEAGNETKSRGEESAKAIKNESVEIKNQTDNGENTSLNVSTPGFTIIYEIVGLLGVFFLQKNKKY